MQRVKKLVCENKIIGLHAIVIGGLTVIAIYNAYWVLEDFFNDNTMINIELKTARNILPFTQYLSVQYYYATDSVFPKALNLNDRQFKALMANNDDEAGWHVTRRLRNRKQEILSSLSKPVGDDLSLETALDISALSAIINQLDREFLVDFTGNDAFASNVTGTNDDLTELYFNLSMGLNADARIVHAGAEDGYTPEVTDIMSAFIESPNTERLVDLTLAQIVGPKFVRLVRPVIPDLDYIPVLWNIDSLNDRSVQVTIPLDFMNNITSDEIVLSLLPYNESKPAPLFSNVAFSHSQFFVRQLLPWSMEDSAQANLLNSTTIDIWVGMSNAAVFDSTEINSESHCRKCENITKMLNCEFKCLIDWLVSTCRCIPFTYRRLYRGYPEINQTPRCTPKQYAKCLLSKPSRSSPCNDQNSVPCLASSHQEQIDITAKVTDIDTETDQMYRLHFRLVSPKGTYVIFENKFQNSWMQMLGQLGGNLGVFLSFSLLGAWQFLIYLQNWINERSAKKSSKSKSVAFASDTQAQKKQTADGKRNEEIDNLQNRIESMLDAKFEQAKRENELLKAGNAKLEKRLRVLETVLGKKKNPSTEL